jgi:hypothetical protein
LSYLPTEVFGTSSMNVHRSGTHHLATRSRRYSDNACGSELCPFADHDARERPLVPLLVGDADDRGLDDVGVADDRVLEVDRGDPLATGLDDVLGAVDDLHEPVGVERADVAGAEPPVVELLGRLDAVVAGGDPRTADLDLADRLAVPGLLGAVGSTIRMSTPGTMRPALARQSTWSSPGVRPAGGIAATRAGTSRSCPSPARPRRRSAP